MRLARRVLTRWTSWGTEAISRISSIHFASGVIEEVTQLTAVIGELGLQQAPEVTPELFALLAVAFRLLHEVGAPAGPLLAV